MPCSGWCGGGQLELSSKYNAMCDAACEKWDRLREGPCKDSLDPRYDSETLLLPG